MALITPSTFSIVAFDRQAEEWGIAVQSKFLGVGPVVPWARAGVGAIATQALANVSYGPAGLDLLAGGKTAEQAVAELTGADEGREQRQLGVVDRWGNAASYTGAECFDWAGHVVGSGYCCQGNILAGPGVVTAMASAYESAGGDLADRLISALEAGQEAGGDRRGQQSACLVVVREGGGYGGYTDRYIDLRTDDHPRPIAELKKLLGLFRLYFSPADPERLLTIDSERAREIAGHLSRLGYYEGSPPDRFTDRLATALRNFCHTENFEERLRDDDLIDQDILDFMRTR